ncbi:MAG: translation initiation factor IF-2 [Eubacterium sp.]|nr:translation initiation factor IF-2 [Eubacterium sp.]
MAKQKIHELAKELKVSNRAIVDYMNKKIKDKEKEKKYTSSNTLEAEEIAEIRANREMLAKADTKPSDARQSDAKASGAKADTKKTDGKAKASGESRPKKKASITAVFNAQYSKQNQKPNRGNKSGGERRDSRRGRTVKPAEKPHIPIRPNADRPNYDRASAHVPDDEIVKPAPEKEDKTKLERVEKADRQEQTGKAERMEQAERMDKTDRGDKTDRNDRSNDRSERSERNDRNDRSERSERNDRNDRSDRNDKTDRSDKADRNKTDRNERNDRADRSDRPDRGERSDRGDRNGRGDRNSGRGDRADRGGRAGGQKSAGGQRGNAGNGRQDRSQNDRGGRNAGSEQKGEKNHSNNRANSGNNYGDKNGGRVGQNRQKEFKGRPDQNLNRFHKDTTKAAPDEISKESRDSRNRDNNRKKGGNNKDYDKLGGKKQERYVNLEKTSGHKKKNQTPVQNVQKEEETIRSITLPEHLTIRELADKMKVQPSVIVKKLFLKGTMVTVNQDIDYERAEEIALEFNCIAEPEEKIDVIAELLKEEAEDESKMVSRPPVVCVMGHVDHGKTSLLDAIRHTRVTDKEAGGITQAIGAYMVKCNGANITFLDTPGHEAFTAMRMRGANSTDIAILVVAADDGVMPQTVEAINHAKAAGIEIIVAVNKIDKPNANIERVKQELSEHELIPEDWGGSTIFVPVSAHTKEGIEQLLEMILLTAEVLELKANPKRNARGVVIEAKLDKGRGAVATVLVQKGTLKIGQPIACGSSYGKVRAMIDDKGRNVKDAKPSMPVEILGLSSVPDAGETFVICESEKEARSFAETYISESKEKLLEETRSRMSLDDLFSQIQSGNIKELNIIVKADVQGSVEAVKQSLQKLSNEEVVVKIIHGGVGSVSESDVSLASASNAIIIGFNVRPDPVAKATAEREGVDIRLYKVIYSAIEDVSAAMKGMLDPIFEEKVLGHAEVRQIFKASGIGNIAGSYILDGIFERGCKCRITREGKQIYEGALASLKRFKDDVKEVKTGFECGLVFEGFNDIAEFDQIEAYKMVEVPR